MRARLLLNLALLALALGLAAIAFYQPGKPEPPPRERFITLDPGSVTRIQIVRSGAETITLGKEQGGWRLQEPLAIRANEVKVNALLRFLETRSPKPLDAKELQRFGLAEPHIRLELNDRVIAFGDSNPLSGERYVLYQGRIYLTPDDLYHDLDREAASLASPSLLEPDQQVAMLALPDLSLRREGAKWSMSPADPRVSGDALVELVDAWKHTQAIAVRRAEPGAVQGSVNIEIKGATPLKYEIRATDPELVLVRPDLGLQYHFFADTGKRLLKPKKTETTQPAKP